MTEQIRLEEGWKARLNDEFTKPYMQELRQFLVGQIAANKTIYPKGSEYFDALNITGWEGVRVVILGQDPYHGPGQAHGLCFSVRPGVPAPPSLQNIYKEMATDLNTGIPDHGYLRSWAEQGVLLLNSVLTVEAGKAGSHQNRGWETFSDAVVTILNNHPRGLAFLLWGSYAQKKGRIIDRSRHLVIESPHPSPLSAHRGFFGSRPFSRVNQFLIEQGSEPIDWFPARPTH